MCNKLLDRKTDGDCTLQEIKGCRIVSEGVYPRADGGDLLRADVKVGVDGGVSAVDKESELTKSAAVADELVDVCMSDGASCAII